MKCLFKEKTDGFGHTESVEKDILGITSVHPMKEEAIRNFLHEIGSDWSVVERLINEGKLAKVNFDGKEFYKSK